MNIKYFKLATFIYYIGIISYINLSGSSFKWTNLLSLKAITHPEVFTSLILPAILIWGTYFILKEK